MDAKNLLVSFSGGETSAFMGQWLNNHYERFGYENIVFVFANTGQENEQTLEFVHRCDKYFNLNIHYVEADVIHEPKKGTRFYMTDFDNASRNGEPFEQIIKKYGIPNQAFPHCTRELKQAPIKAFGKQYFNGEKYDIAIGIRIDEIDRISPNANKMGFIYPLINKDMLPTSKPIVNFYWNAMPFRLELKGYQGNCITCWKKSDKKLYQIAQENPKSFEFMDRMESKYPRVGAEFVKEGRRYQFINGKYTFWETKYKIGDKVSVKTKRFIETEYGGYYADTSIAVKVIENKVWFPSDRTFFRKNRSAKQILLEAQSWNGVIHDDSTDLPIPITQMSLEFTDDSESCEVFSNCGDE